jgi:tetratricopeptide (TPR) repeat protein
VKARLRDTDLHARSRFLRLLFWGGVPGAVLGTAAGAAHALLREGSLAWIPFLALAGGLAVMAVVFLVSEGAGAAAGSLFHPGQGKRRRSEHSWAASLAARGRFDEALAAYEDAAREDPSDPEPFLRGARLLRDDLRQPDEAARWFRRARERLSRGSAREMAVSRELVELYLRKGSDPRRALPELARLAELHAGTPLGDWALEEKGRIRGLVEDERG